MHGSRFGSRLMPSFFYASEKPVTSLAETAYYRFLFLHDMQEPYQKEIDSLHTLFCVAVNAERCLDLLSKPYSDFIEKLTDRVNYSYCQAVGDWAVNQRDVQLIRALSARHPSHCNVAIADPNAIRSREPTQLQSWLCRTSMSKISFSSRQAPEPQTFYVDDFCVDGKLPRPA